MTGDKQQMPARIAERVAKICAEHELSHETLAAILGITEAQLHALEAGRSIMPAVTQRLGKLDADLHYNSLSAWKRRIALSTGLETLIDRNIRILAITSNAPSPDPGAGFSAATIIGRSYHDMLPPLDCTLVRTHGAGLHDLRDIGFFEGDIQCVRFDIEVNYGAFACHGMWEIWPIATLDAGTLGHIVVHVRLGEPVIQKRPGILVLKREIIPSPAGATA